MNTLCRKVTFTIDPATEDDPRSDQRRLIDALEAAGVADPRVSLQALRQLYPAGREGALAATVVHTEREEVATRLELADAAKPCYAIACDYGSTTIVMELVEVESGKALAKASRMNGQVEYGTDILTRITYGLGGAQCKEQLQKVTAETFNALIGDLESESGISRQEYALLVISGNSTMQHFLLGLDAWTVFSAPYKPVTLDAGFFGASELGISLDGMVYLIPGASNYVGGDIMSGLMNLDFYEHEDVSLFFDIGTNGEMIMGNNEWLLGGAGAAGPALEGYISKYGMRAQPGAIETVSIQGGKLSYTTIENEPACGICGSGIIDLLAQMRLAGWIGIDGSFIPKASERIVEVGEGEETQYAVVYAPASESALGEDLVFTQTDIFQYLETKAAAHTMMDCMLDASGLTAHDVKHLYLTGAFCAHANLEAAITLGMFPDLPRERFALLANASLDGARCLIMDASKLDALHNVISRIYCVQFASMPDFMLRMRAAKFIPHTNMSEYPSVAAALEERAHS